ncbi:Rrf2 family transcriptional regulator [Limosilactobacillus sp. STM2_1]|uniref:Rrf2 family transcriptional regulator n=1 Tax=Limosilactobacillus rudii TaxID=2759755 RepID=A0A7W3UMY2_9LACO|nr:Rrf2 family transcriptional regulator [Limosilactobacillus rudii]MBB1079297.1 Rrf2 family transcriptional regulator [Limosilactobacillus rudii]MBB1098509.1 Rrf2 family transcriptional regulator [Limosilactobacillus rudii]MCD7135518.1 Rrf2 family transcriptional regulator [Limosilactobacillus rudii]
MKISTRFSDSIQILAFIDIYQDIIPLTSNNIADSVETSPVVVRRLMSALSKAGLINTVHGTADPQLARKATEISLYDVFLAIEGDAHLFAIDKRTNPACIVGANIQETLNEYYQQAENAAKAKLAATTLQDVINTIRVKQAQKEALQRKKATK